MTPLARKLTEFGIRRFAAKVPTDPVNVRHFLRRRWNKIGRRTRKIIRLKLIEHGLLSPRKPRPRHVCPDCGKLHVQSTHPRTTAQEQTAPRISATRSQQENKHNRQLRPLRPQP